MSLLHLTPQERATHFLEGSTWADMVTTDLNVAPGVRGGVEIAFLAPWPDLTRCTQALTVLDRELRRAATVWTAWAVPAFSDRVAELIERSATVGRAPEELICDSFGEALSLHPEPKRGVGELHVTATQPKPFAVLARPTGRLRDLLLELPTSTLAYAMSAFGQDLRISHFWHTHLPSAGPTEAPEEMRRLLDLPNRVWPGELPQGASYNDRVHGRPTTFRAVTPPPAGTRRPVAVIHATDPAADGTLAAVELLPEVTPAHLAVKGGRLEALL